LNFGNRKPRAATPGSRGRIPPKAAADALLTDGVDTFGKMRFAIAGASCANITHHRQVRVSDHGGLDMAEKPAKGLLFNIQRGSLHDGPGVRTVLFLKGCPLRCVWCQNPESHSREIEYRPSSDPGNRDTPIKIGTYYNPAQALAEIEKDLPFFNETGGGVTFSGGEPTLQPDFLKDLVQLCKSRRIHMTLETCGYFHYDTLIKALSDIELIYYDIKIIDAGRHRRLTGKTNDRILGNLKKLHQEHPNVHVRYVSVPGHNSHEDCLARLAAFLRGLDIGAISILKYNHLWFDKIKLLGKPDPKIKPYPAAEIESCWKDTIHFMQARGFRVFSAA
jgi:pyruvate formate lyase activating enzyme